MVVFDIGNCVIVKAMSTIEKYNCWSAFIILFCTYGSKQYRVFIVLLVL